MAQGQPVYAVEHGVVVVRGAPVAFDVLVEGGDTDLGHGVSAARDGGEHAGVERQAVVGGEGQCRAQGSGREGFEARLRVRGRAEAAWFDTNLVPNDGDDLPGWDLRITAGTSG
ncbi:hypothetical protein [Micromonospora sp. NPDC005324]|uniref:hypothetical protein n=1 Tax=Micromonospora sp. NPDC005324 TaxID=3157033 RepID=UPI00339FC58B